MRKQYKIKLYSLMLAIFLAPSVLAAAECGQKGVTNKSTAVYATPPHYVTGKGWQGTFVRTLPEKTQLYICECRDVEFGFSAKTWCRTAFRPGQEWQYGWIVREDLTDWPSDGKLPEKPAAFSLVREAFAAEKKAAPADTWTLAPPPSVTPAKPTTQSVPVTNGTSPSSSSETGSTFSFLETLKLYWPLFVSMLLGMGAKAGVDLLYAGNKKLAKEHMRNAVVSVLISPIVFLGFLNGGSFQASAQTFLVLCLVAFQNGFFWQTILKRPVTEEKTPTPKQQVASAS